MAKLFLTSPWLTSELLLDEVCTLGRHSTNTLALPDTKLSKHHAEIRRAPDGQYLLRDLGSLNGTLVNGARVQLHTLADGDEITAGAARLRFQDQRGAATSVRIDSAVVESVIEGRLDPEVSVAFRPADKVGDEVALRLDYEKLRLAHALAVEMSLEFDESRLVTKLLNRTFELLPADRGVILLMDPTSHKLVPRRFDLRHAKSDEIVLSQSLLHEVVTKRTGILSRDIRRDPRFAGAESIDASGVRSAMSVPLMVGTELLGVVYVDSETTSHAFSDKDLQLLSAIAAQAAAALAAARIVERREADTRQRATLERLLSPDVVEKVLSGALKLEKGGEEREVSVLFADIRGFTAMSEGRPPSEILGLLNDYFEAMVEVLFRHGGALDKYIGDALMAVFGAPIDVREAPAAAARCALEMQQELKLFNRERSASDQLQIGIGIATGTVVTGMLGSSHRMQFTAIGDTVNTASRLCGLAAAGEVVVNDATARELGEDAFRVEALPPARLKGKRDEVRVFRVTGAGLNSITEPGR